MNTDTVERSVIRGGRGRGPGIPRFCRHGSTTCSHGLYSPRFQTAFDPRHGAQTPFPSRAGSLTNQRLGIAPFHAPSSAYWDSENLPAGACRIDLKTACGPILSRMSLQNEALEPGPLRAHAGSGAGQTSSGGRAVVSVERTDECAHFALWDAPIK